MIKSIHLTNEVLVEDDCYYEFSDGKLTTLKNESSIMEKICVELPNNKLNLENSLNIKNEISNLGNEWNVQVRLFCASYWTRSEGHISENIWYFNTYK